MYEGFFFFFKKIDVIPISLILMDVKNIARP